VFAMRLRLRARHLLNLSTHSYEYSTVSWVYSGECWLGLL